MGSHAWALIVFSAVVQCSSQYAPTHRTSESTCPARTANYIIHSLPQQCLATSRGSTSSTTQVQGVLPTEAVTSSIELLVSLVEADARASPSAVADSSITANSAVPSVQSRAESLPRINDNLPVEETPGVPDINSEDSELESGNFLSFDEWKKQNLKKAGQSEHIGRRSPGDTQEPRKRSIAVQNSLESLGEDGEIDLDFSGFVPGGPSQIALEAAQPVPDSSVQPPSQHGEDEPKPKKRNKDAGTTCKERFNYASFDCAANLLKFNKGAKNPNSVLLENKDSYMLNQCTIQDKYIILELCDDILIDTIVLANYEFFSSTFRTFRVSVSDRWPVKNDKWKTLGTYEAHNTRQVQAFLVENPLIWARYVRIEFLTHYGMEYYCPLSLVRVHGITMMAEWKSGEESSSDVDFDETEPTQAETSVQSSTTETIVKTSESSSTEPEIVSVDTFDGDTEVLMLPLTSAQEMLSQSPASGLLPASVVAMEAIMSAIEPSDTCSPIEKPANVNTDEDHGTKSLTKSDEPSNPRSSPTPQTTTNIAYPDSTSTDGYLTSSKPPSPDVERNVTNVKSITSTISPITSPPPDQRTSTKSGADLDTTETHHNSKSSPKSSSTPAVPDRSKAASSSTLPSPAIPTTQESFFKTVQKRLQMLEANSSLSLQYIEDQSRSLREAFKKVEQRQLSRTNNFLDQLNRTVLQELRDFRQQYDLLWQSTVIELDFQRERYQRDNEAIHARISILADEVIFQRRMAILQMVLILVCLALVLFSRGAINNYLELPLVQNVLGRSPNSRWLNVSMDSLSRPNGPVRVRSAQQLRTERAGILKGHRRLQSDDSITDTQSGNEIYAPPTPVSDYGQSEIELSRDEERSPIESEADGAVFDDPQFDPMLIERPATSPPMLQVNNADILMSDLELSGEESLDTRILNSLHTLAESNSTMSLSSPESVAPAKRLSWNLPAN